MKEVVLQNFGFILLAFSVLLFILIYLVLIFIGYKPRETVKTISAAISYIILYLLIEAILCRIIFGKEYEYYVGYYLFYLFAAYIDYRPRDLIRSSCITIILSIVLAFGSGSKESFYEFLVNFSIGFMAINFASIIFISLQKLINFTKEQWMQHKITNNINAKTISIDKENDVAIDNSRVFNAEINTLVDIGNISESGIQNKIPDDFTKNEKI
jgi:membrane protein